MGQNESPSDKVVVTGCAGFIGSHLVERLLGMGYTVVGIDSFEDYYARELKEANLRAVRENRRFELVEANVLDLAGLGLSRQATTLEELVADVDYVFHLAAQAGVRASWGDSFRIYTENNVLATQTLLEACRSSNLKRFVYASSSSVYGDTDVLPMREDAICRPVSPYGVTKLAGEQLGLLYNKNFDVPVVALRFFTVYGPRQRPDMAFNRFIRAMLEGRPICLYGNGSQTRDFTFISDILDGLIASLEAPRGAVYNLGGGSRVSLIDAVKTLEEGMGVGAVIEADSVQAGDVTHTWADLSAAVRDLSYDPRVGLAEGLRLEAEWLESAIAAGLA